MGRVSCFRTVGVTVVASFLCSSAVFASSATLQNAGFDTYIAASDSFAYWKADRDPTGTRFRISQETTAPASGTGALKMEIMAGADTATECRVTGEIKNLLPNKIFTVTAKVKYSSMPTYWNAMLHLQQATLNPPDWKWIDREWISFWGNNPGTVAEWTTISASDTTADSANIFNLIISLRHSGTLWVDDIAISYKDVPVLRNATRPARKGSMTSNRITFGYAMPYTVEAYNLNGKQIVHKTGTAGSIDLNALGLQRGGYVVKVGTAQKTWSKKVMIGR